MALVCKRRTLGTSASDAYFGVLEQGTLPHFKLEVLEVAQKGSLASLAGSFAKQLVTSGSTLLETTIVGLTQQMSVPSMRDAVGV